MRIDIFTADDRAAEWAARQEDLEIERVLFNLTFLSIFASIVTLFCLFTFLPDLMLKNVSVGDKVRAGIGMMHRGDMSGIWKYFYLFLSFRAWVVFLLSVVFWFVIGFTWEEISEYPSMVFFVDIICIAAFVLGYVVIVLAFDVSSSLYVGYARYLLAGVMCFSHTTFISDQFPNVIRSIIVSVFSIPFNFLALFFLIPGLNVPYSFIVSIGLAVFMLVVLVIVKVRN